MVASPSMWSERWKRIRPFVSFKLNPRKGLSDYQKRKVRKYYKAIQVLDSPSRPVHVYRGKTGSKRLKGAQEYARHPRGVTQLRVAFIPNPSGQKVRLKFKKNGKISDIVTENGIKRTVYLFKDYEDTPGEALTDPDAVIARIKKKDGGKSDFFHILNGEWEIGSGEFAIKFVAAEVKRLASEYAPENIDDQTHAAERWLFGIAGYSFFDQASFSEYKKARGMRDKKKKAKKKNTGKENA